MSNIYAGFDLSLTATGYVFLFKDGKYDAGVISIPQKGMKRCYAIRDMIKKLCRRYVPDNICMEGYSFGSRGMLADLGELGGLVKELFDVQLALPYTIVGPNQLKKFGVEFEDDNECDAYVLAKIAQALCVEDTSLGIPQQEVISKLKNGGKLNEKTRS
jgi:hypothetical protein